MIIHGLRSVFVHIPKTGGTTIRDLLQLDLSVTHDGPERCPAEVWSEFFTFCFVRNPWDKMVSSWAYHTSENYNGVETRAVPGIKEMSFHDYVYATSHRYYWRQQTSYLKHPKTGVPIDFVGRFERFEQDVRDLCRRLGLQREIPHMNRSEHTSYSDYYDAGLRDVVASRFSEDIALLGYHF